MLMLASLRTNAQSAAIALNQVRRASTGTCRNRVLVFFPYRMRARLAIDPLDVRQH